MDWREREARMRGLKFGTFVQNQLAEGAQAVAQELSRTSVGEPKNSGGITVEQGIAAAVDLAQNYEASGAITPEALQIIIDDNSDLQN